MSDKFFAIVGIDPGATIAVSVIDLSGRKRHLESFKNEGISEAARVIERHCTPSLLACDVRPAPEAVLRLASYFSCRAFAPSREIREDEKKRIATGAGAKNTHERDAYCAAVIAYRMHANKLRQIDALSEVPCQERDRVKHLLLRGYRVQDAFLLLREPEGKKEERSSAAPSKTATPEELRMRLESLARENANLRLQAERLEAEKDALSQKLRLFENGVRQSLLRDSEYRRLRFQLEESLRRLSFRKKRGAEKQGRDIAPARESQHPKSDKEGINTQTVPKLDLEGLVEEYRKGRHKIV